MEYIIRNLELFESIECDGEDKNGKLYNCYTDVTQKTLEAPLDKYIEYDSQINNNIIPAGKYLFVQGIFLLKDNNPITTEVKEAANSLWLEFLWKEKIPADRTIYLRVLTEKHGNVFQLMRKVKE